LTYFFPSPFFSAFSNTIHLSTPVGGPQRCERGGLGSPAAAHGPRGGPGAIARGTHSTGCAAARCCGHARDSARCCACRGSGRGPRARTRRRRTRWPRGGRRGGFRAGPASRRRWGRDTWACSCGSACC